MSGRKTTIVTVDSRELDRLRTQAAHATTLAASNRAMNALNASLTNSLNNANNRINTLNSNLNSLNNRIAANDRAAKQETLELRQQLQAAVKESNDRLAAQSAAHQRDMETLRTGFHNDLNRLRTDVADAMDENNRRIEQVMDTNNQIINSRLRAANSRIDAINAALAKAGADQALLLEMAQEFLDAANALNADSQTYRCELLLPGQLKDVLQAAADAETQCKIPGNASAAQLDARDAYREALAFHERIVEAEQVWNQIYQGAQLSVAQAQARIENSREVTHEATGVRLDVNHWSDGDLQALETDANALNNQLQQASQFTLQDLENIRSAGEQIENETVETVAFTLGAAESSQWRTSVAAILGRSLRNNNGLRLDGRGYQGGDSRAAYRMRLINNSGFEMVITQTPVTGPNGEVNNQLEMDIINPGTYNDATARTLAADIQNVLTTNGFNVGSLNTVPGCDDLGSGRKETAKIPEWRTEQATTTVRPVRRHRTTTAAKQK